MQALAGVGNALNKGTSLQILRTKGEAIESLRARVASLKSGFSVLIGAAARKSVAGNVVCE